MELGFFYLQQGEAGEPLGHETGRHLIPDALGGLRSLGAIATEDHGDDPGVAFARGRNHRGVGRHGPAGLEPVASFEGAQEAVVVH